MKTYCPKCQHSYGQKGGKCLYCGSALTEPPQPTPQPPASETPSKWVQQLIPGQTRDCIHGQLARSCNICELEHEVFDLNVELTAARNEITRLMEKCVAADFEAEAQKRRADKAETEIKALREIIVACAKTAGGNVSPECSLEFLAKVPVEVSLACKQLAQRSEDWEKVADKLQSTLTGTCQRFRLATAELLGEPCDIPDAPSALQNLHDVADARQLYTETKNKHAAPTLEECDLCHEQAGVSKLQLSESGQMLCEKCRTNK